MFIIYATGPDDPCQPYKTTQVTIKYIFVSILRAKWIFDDMIKKNI